MSDQTESVGYKRPPKSGQFKKGRSGNPGGLRKKNGSIKLDLASIVEATFPVKIGGQTRTMTSKEIELRNILKKGLEKKHFNSIAHLLESFEKHGCVEQSNNRTCGVLTLPTNSMPSRMAWLLFEQHGLPENWTKRQIARARKQYEATKTDQESQFEAAAITT